MPVILNLIRESLKPVTVGAVGGEGVLCHSDPHFLYFPNRLYADFSYKARLSAAPQRQSGKAVIVSLR